MLSEPLSLDRLLHDSAPTSTSTSTEPSQQHQRQITLILAFNLENSSSGSNSYAAAVAPGGAGASSEGSSSSSTLLSFAPYAFVVSLQLPASASLLSSSHFVSASMEDRTHVCVPPIGPSAAAFSTFNLQAGIDSSGENERRRNDDDDDDDDVSMYHGSCER